jgi:hypothetical protein
MAILIARSTFAWEPILAWFGEISFSIYLIHWPLVVIALSRYQGLSATIQILIATGSILSGYLISRLIENPFRYHPKLSLSLPRWGVALTAIAALLFATTNLVSTSAAHSNFSIDLSEPIIYHDKCHLDFGVSKPVSPCFYGDLRSSKVVVLTGDSHAAQWFDALNAVALKLHWKVLALTKSSCPASFLPTVRNGSPDATCAQWQRYIAARIKTLQPSKVIVTAFSEYRYSLVQVGSYPSLYAKGQADFLRALGLPAASIYYIEDTPHPAHPVTDCLSKNPHSTGFCDFPLTRSDATLSTRSVVTTSGVHYLNFSNIFCPLNNCRASYLGHNTYRDGSHISVSTSKALAIELESKLK